MAFSLRLSSIIEISNRPGINHPLGNNWHGYYYNRFNSMQTFRNQSLSNTQNANAISRQRLNVCHCRKNGHLFDRRRLESAFFSYPTLIRARSNKKITDTITKQWVQLQQQRRQQRKKNRDLPRVIITPYIRSKPRLSD